MTVTVETPITSAIANGVTTVFPYAFTVLEAADLKVIGELSGVTTTYVLGVQYTVSGLGSGSGSVTFLSPPVNGTVITLYRDSQIQRSTDYQEHGDLPASLVNQDFDRLWLVLQEIFNGGKGAPTSIRVPSGETVQALPARADRASTIFAFDANGDPALTVGFDAGSAIALDLNLRDTTVSTKGAGQVGIGLPSLNYVAKSIGAVLYDNSVNILSWASEVQRVAIRAKTYADDHTSLLAAAYAWANGRPIYMPAGGYKLSHADLAKAGQILYGDGWGNSIIRATDPTLHLFTVLADNVTIQGLELHGAATSATTSRFAIFTDTATPAKGLKVLGVKISGQDASHGFTNGVKFDDACDNAVATGNYVERLWGTASGFGYGILTGNIKDGRIWGNWLYGAAGRGRHGIYLSGGATGCEVLFNLVDSFVYDGITQFSQGAQPPCTDNLIAYNRVPNCASVAALSSGAISIAGHALRTKIVGNIIPDSLSCGIKVEGTGFLDMKETEITGNTIAGADFVGIDLVAAVGGKLDGNSVTDSGVTGGLANVRFVSDGATATKNWLVQGNRIPASAISRSAFQVNATVPVPTGLRFSGNQVGSGTVTDYEFGSQVYTVDGMRRVSMAFNWPAIANGASFMQTFTPAEFADMPAGSNVEATYTGNTDGCIFECQCLVAGTVRVTLANFSGASKTATGGSVVLTWTGAI